jgi:indole-3-glycerol phosphate synthase
MLRTKCQSKEKDIDALQMGQKLIGQENKDLHRLIISVKITYSFEQTLHIS